MTSTVYLLHGRDSSPQSLKISRLSAIARRAGWNVVAPDFSHITDPDERVAQFLAMGRQPCARSVFVGSSMGAYVALVASASCRPDGLLLLAPAVGLAGYRQPEPEPVAGTTSIIHGWGDALIAPETVFAFAARHNVDLHLVDDEHPLQRSLPLIEEAFAQLLEACHPASRSARLVSTL